MKYTTYSIVAIVISSLASCSSNEPQIEKDEPTSPTTTPTVDTINTETGELLYLDASERKVFNELSSFGEKLVDNMGNNTVNGEFTVSPISMSIYLGLLANSCDGNTREQILTALGQENLEDMNNVCKKVLDYLPSNATGSTMRIANHVWVSDKYTVPEQYKNVMGSVFNAGVDNVDFTVPTTIPSINKWVSDNTNGLIKSLFDGDWHEYINTKTTSANTVYFMGKWMQEFDPALTDNQIFHSSNGDRQVSMMHITDNMLYGKNEYGEKLIINFTGKINTLEIYLPASGTDAKDITKVMNAEVRNNMPLLESIVTLSLPKFNSGCSLQANDVIASLGIDKLSDVNLSPMGIDATAPFSIIHKTYISVDEKGAELAAVTGGGDILEWGDNYTPQDVTMTVDRPFMYIVRNACGAILMAGVVANPK